MTCFRQTLHAAEITGIENVGALCLAEGLPLSAHTSPTVHQHVCCALPAARHVEYFHDHTRIEHMCFEGAATQIRGNSSRPTQNRPRHTFAAQRHRQVQGPLMAAAKRTDIGQNIFSPGDWLVRLHPRWQTNYVGQSCTVIATDPNGWILPVDGQGLFVHETRLLSRYQYFIDEQCLFRSHSVTSSSIRGSAITSRFHLVFRPNRGIKAADRLQPLRRMLWS